MPGTVAQLETVSHYSMQIECPTCSTKMTLHVGLMGDPKNNSLECIECHSAILPLHVPGQIVGGPFPALN